MIAESTQLVNYYQEFSTFIQSPDFQNIATLLGITGVSLRDFKGRVGLNKFENKFSKLFPGGLETETQNAILSDSLLEIKDYIENNPNLDDKIFEEINKILLNGLSTEEMLTRLYIKILKELSFIDLIILKKIKNIKLKSKLSYESTDTTTISFLINQLSKTENNEKFPKEIIKSSCMRLKSEDLISEHGNLFKSLASDPIVTSPNDYALYTHLSELGESLLNIMNKETV